MRASMMSLAITLPLFLLACSDSGNATTAGNTGGSGTGGSGTGGSGTGGSGTGGSGGSGGSGGGTAAADVTFLHTSDGTAVRFFVDFMPGQNPIVEISEFGSVAGVVSLPAGEHVIRVETAVPDPIFVERKVVLEAGHRYSFGAVGMGGNPALSVVDIGPEKPSAQDVRLHIVSARPNQVTGLVCPQLDFQPNGMFYNVKYMGGGCEIPYGEHADPLTVATDPNASSADMIGQWGDGANPPIEQVIFNILDLLANVKGGDLELYFTCTGACTKDDVKLLAHYGDKGLDTQVIPLKM